MARTLHADLTTAQNSGYPTGAHKPYIVAVFTSKDGGTTYTYTFDPTLTTNRLLRIKRREDSFHDSAEIVIRNDDLTVPDLTGFYVDLGYGLNTSSGNRAADTNVPRLWVKSQEYLSEPKILKSILTLGGVWEVFLNDYTPMIPPATGYETNADNIGIAPNFYQDSSNIASPLYGKTQYGILEYLIETTLTNATGYTFTLDALGTQDDSIINTDIIPFEINKAPYDTFGSLFKRIMAGNKCYLRVGSGGTFTIVYPQSSDAVNETYYSDAAPLFYRYDDIKQIPRYNHVRVYCHEAGGWDITGDAYDPDFFDMTTSPPTILSNKAEHIWYEQQPAIDTQTKADNCAAALLAKSKAEVYAGRLVIPHDARPELFDRVAVVNNRGK